MIAMNPLELECRTFTRYLIGRDPEPYVIEKYAEAHCVTSTYAGEDRFGRALATFARIHPVTAKLADSYARLFVPRSLLRKKLVLLLAILETCAPSYKELDQVDLIPKPLLLLRLAGRGVGALLSLLVGCLLLLPLHLMLGRGWTR